MRKLITLLTLAIVTALTSGCASVPLASQELDTQAKQFHVPAGKSRIYVYRNESLGGAMKIVISLDGMIVGSNAPMTYFALDVAPGKHQVACIAENNNSLSVDSPSGKPVFVWQEMKMGALSARCALHLVDTATGRRGVNESSMAASNP